MRSWCCLYSGNLVRMPSKKKLAIALADHYEFAQLCNQDANGLQHSVISDQRTVEKFRCCELFNTVVTPIYKIPEQKRAMATLPASGLETLVATSPLSNTERKSLCIFMNRDWEYQPAFRIRSSDIYVPHYWRVKSCSTRLMAMQLR